MTCGDKARISPPCCSLLGGTSAALTGLVLPGCLAAATGQRAGGALLAAIGAALVANFLLRLAVYGLPPV